MANVKKRYYIYLFFLIIITLAVTAVSLSKYSTTIDGSVQATVAKPVIGYVPQGATLNAEPITPIISGIAVSEAMPGDELVFHFDILNYEGANTNEVLLKYKITVTLNPSPTNLPLDDYTLEPTGSYPSAGEGWTYMSFGEQITHSYILTVTWPSDANDSSYQSKQQSINIEIESQQVDSLT